MNIFGKHIVVVGFGRTGQSVTRFALKKGARVTVLDSQPVDKNLLSQFFPAEWVQTKPTENFLRTSDLIVVSPGVPWEPPFSTLRKEGHSVMSEIEFASHFIESRIVAITGTNGKSTVTTLIGKMCESLRSPLFVGGNLGTPLVDACDTPAAAEGGLIVAEVSSFQLEPIEQFQPFISICLNITPDHLDRHHMFASYAAAKARIFHNQSKHGHALIPHGDKLIEGLAKAGFATIHMFGGSDGEVRVINGQIEDRVSGLRIPVSRLKVRGNHNQINLCAAILASRLCGVSAEAQENVALSFAGLNHRMQLIRTLEEVEYIDDSKATNVGAAVASIQSIDRPVVLIAGGKDKGGGYDPLVQAAKTRCRALVLIGEAASLIEQAVQSSVPTVRAPSMTAAVETARELASKGDAVLLAPACASFDMFKSYKDRGEVFQSAVHQLKEEVS